MKIDLVTDASVFVAEIGFALFLGGLVSQIVTHRNRVNAAILWGSVIDVVALAAYAGLEITYSHDDLPRYGDLVLGGRVLVTAVATLAVMLLARRSNVPRPVLAVVALGLVAENAAAVFYF